MAVQALGYLGISTHDIDESPDFATRQLGLQLADRGVSCRAFRIANRCRRVIADRERPDAERFFGWQDADLEVFHGPRPAGTPVTPARFLAFRRSARRTAQ
jgi:catechol 2,3-dioxygenase-like lactoylglutathione lyase family enzyme